MIDKLTFFRKLFNHNILKDHLVNKNKNKMFILFSDNNKLNWILFRNIFTRSHHQFNLSPILFVTDTLGFEDYYNTDPDLNPVNPTFNFFTDVERNLNHEEYVHSEIEGLLFSVLWSGIENLAEMNISNLLLFTTNLQELDKMIEIGKAKDKEVVVFYLQNKKKQEWFLTEKNIEKYKHIDIWKVPYSPNILKRWDNVKLWDVIKTRMYFKNEHRLKKIRNSIWIIMNQYYKYSIVPSFIDDEDIYKKEGENVERIEGLYERENKK